MSIIAAYYRSSTKLQKNSIEMQRSVTLEKALSNSEFIDREYPDEAVSARKLDIDHREKLSQLLYDIDHEPIKKLYVYKRDRLARKAYEYLEIYQILKKHKIEVIFTSGEQPILYTPEGELFEFLMAGLIEHEGEQIIERLKARQRARFMSDNYFGSLPYGYRQNENKDVFEHIDEEIDVIKDIYNRLEQGASPNEIANSLNEEGRFYRKKKWDSQRIINLASNPTYKGIRIFGKSSEDPVIRRFINLKVVNEEKWNKANEQLKRWKRPRKQKQKVEYLLKKYVFCKKCKNKIPLKTHNHKYECKEHGISIGQEQLESLVFEQCKNYFTYLLTEEFKGLFEQYRSKNIAKVNKHIDELRLKLRKVESELFKAVENRLDMNNISEEEFADKVNQIMRRHKNCVNAIEGMSQEGREFEEFYEILQKAMIKRTEFLVFDQLEFDEKRKLLGNILSEVILNGYDIDLTLKQPFKGLGLKEVIPYDNRN